MLKFGTIDEVLFEKWSNTIKKAIGYSSISDYYEF